MNPRIYVACLKSYNAGVLHGRWIDINQTEDEIQAEIDEMLAKTGGEEWRIDDTEDCGNLFSEFASLARLAHAGAMIAEHGNAWIAYAENESDPDASERDFQDHYSGEWDSLEAWAENFLEDTGSLPKDSLLARYFDFERYARDCHLSGDVWTADNPDGGVFVFHS